MGVVRAARAFVLVLLLVPAAAALGPRAFAHEDAQLVRLLGELAMAVDGYGDIYGCVDAITHDFPAHYRLMGTPTHDLFLEKYGHVFTDRYGLTSQVVHFEKGGASVVPGQTPIQGGDNILGVLPGRSLTKWVVVGGHYDTRELTLGGGAYDNTSGLCTVLEVAKAFAQLKIRPEATVVFALWDGEEWGLYGSRAFLADHNATKDLLGIPHATRIDFLAAESFDMVGLNYPAMNTWVRYGDPTNLLETAVLNLRTAPTAEGNFTLCPSYGCYRYDRYTPGELRNFTNYQALVREVVYRFLEFPPGPVQVYDDQYGRSDHVPFIAAGVPGMRIQGSHDDEYPHYHEPTDTLQAMTLLAGDDTHLRAGFDKAADVGALVLAYVAMKGDVGEYGTGPETAHGAPKVVVPPPRMPGFEAILGLLASGLALALRRR